MSVLIYDTIKSKNGKFPIAESNDIKGGPFYKQNAEEMKSINEKLLTNGCKCYVAENKTTYEYEDGNWKISSSLIYVNDIEERDALNNVKEGCIVIVKDIGNGQGQGAYLYTNSENSYVKISNTELRNPELTVESNKKTFNLNDSITFKFNYISSAPGNYKLTIRDEFGNLTTRTNNTKGEFNLAIGKASEEKTYIYYITAEDIYGLVSNEIEIKAVCGGLKFSTTFTDMLNNEDIIFGTESDITFNYNSYSTDTTINTIYNKFVLSKDDKEIYTQIISKDNDSKEVEFTIEKAHFEESGVYHLNIYQSIDDFDYEEKLSEDFSIMGNNSYSIIAFIGDANNKTDKLDEQTTLYLNYKVTYYNEGNETSTLYMKAYIYDKDNKVITSIPPISIKNNKNNRYTLGRLSEGLYTCKIIVGANNNLDNYLNDLSRTKTINFSIDENKLSSNYITDNLLLFFDSNNRGTDDSEKDIWKPTKDSKYLGYKIKLNKLSHNYNDYITNDDKDIFDSVNGWVNDTDDTTMLKFTGDSYGYLVDSSDNFVNPFDKTYKFINMSSTNENSKGFSFECYFRTRYSGDEESKVVSTNDNYSLSNFYLGYNSSKLSSNKESTTLGYLEDKWNHIVFTFDISTREVNVNSMGTELQDSIEDCNPYPTMRIYLNGSLSSVSALNDVEKLFLEGSSNLPFTLNAIPYFSNDKLSFKGFGECEIKVIRFYGAALKPSEILTNYKSVLNKEEANKLNESNDTSSLKIPIVRFKRLNITTENTTTNGYISTFKQLNGITNKAISKTDFVPCNVSISFLNDNNEEENFEATAQVYLQGTSSLAYPVKNYKIKYGNFKNSNGENINKGIYSKFSKQSYNFDQKGIYKGWTIPEKTFTLKCDYMESSHLNNTPTAKFFDEIVLPRVTNGNYSPAKTKKYHDAIDGFPVIVYYYDNFDMGADGSYIYNNEQYAGTYMFNLDKSANSLGFEPYTNDELINNKTLTNKCLSFECASNKDEYAAGCWYSYIETAENILENRNLDVYKEYITWKEEKTRSNEDIENKLIEFFENNEIYVTDNDKNKKIYTPLLHVSDSFELRYDYDEDRTSKDNDIKSIKFSYLNKAITFIADSYNSYKKDPNNFKINSFKEEFKKYFDEGYTLTYFLQMMMFGQVDNAGKNSMWDTWLTRVTNTDSDGNTIYYDKDDREIEEITIDGKIRFKYKDIKIDNVNRQDYYLDDEGYVDEDYMKYNAKFYIRPYDMDTQVGLNNTGEDVIGSDVELNNTLQPTKIFIGNSAETSIEVGNFLNENNNYWHFYQNELDEIPNSDENKHAKNTRFFTYNTNKAKFWNLFAKTYTEDISSMYKQLRDDNIYSIENIMNFYSGITSKIGCKYFNLDMSSKFLNIKTKDGYNKGYLYAINGDRRARFENWINERLIFLDSYYDYYLQNNNVITFRSDCTLSQNDYIAIETYSPQYVTLKLGAQTTDITYKIYVSPDYYYSQNNGIKVYGTMIRLPQGQYTNKETSIYGAKNIKRIDNLNKLGPSSFDLSNWTKVTSINLSSQSFNSITVPNTQYLRSLNLDNCPNLASSINLSNCRNLRTLNVNNTSLTGITFPKTGSLSYINVSKTNITNFTIENLMNLDSDNLFIDNCEKLETISIINCNINKLIFDDIVLDDDNTISFNLIKSKNVTISKCSNLEYLNLTKLYVSGSLTITDNENLSKFIMVKNNSTLNTLDLSSNEKLKYIDLFSNSNLINLILPVNNGNINNNLKILTISNCGKLKCITNDKTNINEIVDLSYCKNLALVCSNKHKTITNSSNRLTGFFENCSSIKYIYIDNSDANECDANGYYMFYNCTNLINFIKNSNLNLNNDYYTNDNLYDYKENNKSQFTKDITAMFYNCQKLGSDNNNVFDNFNLNLQGIKVLTSCFLNNFCMKFTDISKFLKFSINDDVSSIINLIYFCYNVGKNNISNIPNDFFEGLGNVTRLDSCFINCQGISYIDTSLFDPFRETNRNNNLKLNIVGMFRNCRNLEFIYSPNGKQLFNGILLDSVANMFNGCTKLQGFYTDSNEINYTFFDETNGESLTNIKGLFSNCKKLIINKNAINDNENITIKITKFNNTQDKTISNCKNMIIFNEDFLSNLSKLKYSNWVFVDCEQLSCEVPNLLFKNNINLVSISGFFAGSGITKLVSETKLFNIDIEYSNLKYAQSLFANCTQLSNDSKAGKYLFTSHKPNGENQGGAVNLCDIGENVYIEEISEGYTDSSNKIIAGYYGMFSNCSLNNFSIDLFKEMKQLTTVNKLFYNTKVNERTINFYDSTDEIINSVNSNLFNEECLSNIKSLNYFYTGNKLNGKIEEEFFNKFENISDTSYCFAETKFDEQLIHNLNGLYKECYKLNNVDYTFKNSNIISDISEIQLFTNCSKNSLSLSMKGLFYGTKIIGNIPIGLFNTIRNKVTNTSLMFYNCEYLGSNSSGSTIDTSVNSSISNCIPTGKTGDEITFKIQYDDGTKIDVLDSKKINVEGLLGCCFKLTNVAGMFAGCTRIAGAIPNDLFWMPSLINYIDNNGNSHSTICKETFDVEDISYLFEYCVSLNKPYKVNNDRNYICDGGIFKNLTKVKSANGTFANLAKISGYDPTSSNQNEDVSIYIPIKIFDNMNSLQSTSYCFACNTSYSTLVTGVIEKTTDQIYKTYTLHENLLGNKQTKAKLFNNSCLSTSLADTSYMFLKCNISCMNKYFLFALNEDNINNGDNYSNNILSNVNYMFYKSRYASQSTNYELPLINDATKFRALRSYANVYATDYEPKPQGYDNFNNTITNVNLFDFMSNEQLLKNDILKKYI